MLKRIWIVIWINIVSILLLFILNKQVFKIWKNIYTFTRLSLLFLNLCMIFLLVVTLYESNPTLFHDSLTWCDRWQYFFEWECLTNFVCPDEWEWVDPSTVEPRKDDYRYNWRSYSDVRWISYCSLWAPELELI